MTETIEITDVVNNSFDLGVKTGRNVAVTALMKAFNESKDKSYRLGLLSAFEILDRDIYELAKKVLDEE